MEDRVVRFMSMVMAKVEKDRLESIDSKGAATLGELIALLTPLPPQAQIVNASADLDSYRGYYSDLAIEPGVTVVEDLLAALKDAVGRTYTGYKGGDFTMTRTTRVWISHYGMCSQKFVTGIEPYGSDYILATGEED